MKVLIYSHRKNDGEMYDINTPDQESAAYLRLFAEFDNYWSAYDDLEDVEPLTPCEPCSMNLCRHCEKGNCVCESETCKPRAMAARRRAGKEARWKTLVDEARSGNAASAKKLITERSREGYEYEIVREAEVQDSVKELARYSKELKAEAKEKAAEG
jgi:hypothetical protein